MDKKVIKYLSHRFYILKIRFIWIINICLTILKLHKRDDTLWIFGCWSGETYSDNSKYFFEYIILNFPEINAVWITKNRDIKNQLHSENKKCYLFNEKEGYKSRLNAKYIFFTHGITDFGTYDLCHGSIKVALGHGMPLKKLEYAKNDIKKRNSNIIKKFKYIYLKLYDSTQRDMTIATSKATKGLLIECFELKESSVLITGQPRNDILFEKNNVSIVKNRLKHEKDEKFVLYMPTWRAFRKQELFLEDIINKINSNTQFLKKLQDKKIKLYIKPHPRIIITSKSKDNVIIIDNNTKLDTQHLIASADSLITDYSSVFIDYALLNRPLYFYIPDREDYQKNGNDLLLSFEEFSEFTCQDFDCFMSIIIANKALVKKGIHNANKINTIFNNSKLEAGSYSKYVFNEILKNSLSTRQK